MGPNSGNRRGQNRRHLCNETLLGVSSGVRPKIALNQTFSANSGAKLVSSARFAVEWGSFTTDTARRQRLQGRGGLLRVRAGARVFGGGRRLAVPRGQQFGL